MLSVETFFSTKLLFTIHLLNFFNLKEHYILQQKTKNIAPRREFFLNLGIMRESQRKGLLSEIRRTFSAAGGRSPRGRSLLQDDVLNEDVLPEDVLQEVILFCRRTFSTAGVEAVQPVQDDMRERGGGSCAYLQHSNHAAGVNEHSGLGGRSQLN